MKGTSNSAANQARPDRPRQRPASGGIEHDAGGSAPASTPMGGTLAALDLDARARLLLGLQRQHGNAAVGRLIAAQAPVPREAGDPPALQHPELSGRDFDDAYQNKQPLRVGDSRRDTVARFQTLLADTFGLRALMPKTFHTGVADGTWGAETTAAVRQFQQDHGVRPVGGAEAGHKTLRAMDRDMPRGSGPVPPGPVPVPPGPVPPGPVPPGPVPPGPVPPGPVGTDGPAFGAGADGRELPVAGESAGDPQRDGGVLRLDFAVPGAATVATPGVTPAAAPPANQVATPTGADTPVGSTSAVEVQWHGSTHESVFALVRVLVKDDAARAAEITRTLLADPSNVFVLRGRHVAQSEFEAQAGKDGKFALLPEAVDRLSALCGTDRQGLALGVEIDKRFGRLLEEKDRLNFNDPRKNTAAQKGRETGRDKEKRAPVQGNRALLADERLAKIYLDLMVTHAGVPSAQQTKAAGGLDALELREIIDGNPQREFLTDLFTQGVVDHRATIGEPSGAFVLMGTLFEQVTWGNPTANRNLLRIGVGKPEDAPGLVYTPDGTLYYSADGVALQSFGGEGKRDPGFNANPKPKFGFNLEAIDDPVLKGFFRLLKQQGEESSLIFRGAFAYFENMELVNAKVQAQLPAKIKEVLAETLVAMGLFLLGKGLIIAAERSRIAALQALGVALDALLLGAQALMDIEFLDTTTARLAGAGFHLCRVAKGEDGTFTKQAEYHLNAGAEQIATIIAQFSATLILKLGAKGAKEFMQKVRGGEPAQLKCTTCEIDPPNRIAQEFNKETYKRRLRSEQRRGRKVKAGDILVPGDPRFPSIEMHPDGNVFGTHLDVQKFHLAGETSGRRDGKQTVFESHHIFEDSALSQFGVDRNKAWAGSFESEDHQRFTTWMAQESRRIDDIDVLYDRHRRMYQDLGHPELLKQLDRAVSEGKEIILQRYLAGDVPTAGFPAFAERRARVLKFLKRF